MQNQQLSLFDYMAEIEQPREQPDFETMPIEKLADIIGNAIGVSFTWNKRLERYEYSNKKNKLSLDFCLGHYSCDTAKKKEGDAMIGVGWESTLKGFEGCGGPCDSIDEAINFFRAALKRFGSRNCVTS